MSICSVWCAENVESEDTSELMTGKNLVTNQIDIIQIVDDICNHAVKTHRCI